MQPVAVMRELRIGVIGFSYWGSNVVRNFSNCALTQVVPVAEREPERRRAAAAQDRDE